MELRVSISTVSTHKKMLSRCHCKGNMEMDLSTERENLTSESLSHHGEGNLPGPWLPVHRGRGGRSLLDGLTWNKRQTGSKLEPPPKFRGRQSEIKPICS